jgi:hypothetical protein
MIMTHTQSPSETNRTPQPTRDQTKGESGTAIKSASQTPRTLVNLTPPQRLSASNEPLLASPDAPFDFPIV